jgi:OmpA-OmpF porin, OOP family
MIMASRFGQQKINHNSKNAIGIAGALRAGVVGLVALVVAGCASLVDDARDMTPEGSAFQQALYAHYLDMAVSRGEDWRSEGSADFYAQKAIEAGNGVNVIPLAAPTDVAAAAELAQAYDRLQAAFAQGAQNKFPDLAARAQVAYDCWAYEASQGAPTTQVYQCKARFLTLMGRMEVDLAPAPAPVAAALPDEANYIVYFGFDEWFLTAEALEVLSVAIETARDAGHSKIISGGHTDTAGPSGYNDDLSLRRAEIVKITLVEMGALPDAIEIIGYGESRLAIETGDGVREPLNRRTVVTLVP